MKIGVGRAPGWRPSRGSRRQRDRAAGLDVLITIPGALLPGLRMAIFGLRQHRRLLAEMRW
jgi:hypothetical protein